MIDWLVYSYKNMQNDSPKAKVQCNTKILIIYYIYMYIIHYIRKDKV